MADDFDPDQYLAESDNDFDPDSYLSEKAKNKPFKVNNAIQLANILKQDPEAFNKETELSGKVVGRALSGGWTDKLAAAANTLLGENLGESYGDIQSKREVGHSYSPLEGTLKELYSKGESALEAIPEAYKRNYQERTGNIKQFEQENPNKAKIAEILGLLGSPINRIAPNIGRGKIAQAASSGAVTAPIFAAGMAEPDEDVNYLEQAALGGAIGGGIAGISSIPRATAKALQKPQQAYEYVAEKVGSKIPNEFIKRDQLANTGSKLVDSLRKASSQAAKTIENTNLDPMMSVDDAMSDPLLKDQMLNAIKKTIRSRGRDAFDIPIGELEAKITQELQNNPGILSQPLDEFLSITFKMTPSQRAQYFKLDQDWPVANIESPEFQTAQDSIRKLLQGVEEGKLNMNFEDVAKYGQGERTATIGGINIGVPQEYKSFTERLGQSEQFSRESALKRLKDISRGTRQLDKGIFGKYALKPLRESLETTGSIGRSAERKLDEKNALQIARGISKDASVLNQLAQQGGSLAQIAQNALRNLQQGDEKKSDADAFLFSMNPEFRKSFLGDTTNQGQ